MARLIALGLGSALTQLASFDGRLAVLAKLIVLKIDALALGATSPQKLQFCRLSLIAPGQKGSW